MARAAEEEVARVVETRGEDHWKPPNAASRAVWPREGEEVEEGGVLT